MSEPIALDYYYGLEAEQYTFFRIPKILFSLYLEGGGYLVSWCLGHMVEMAAADAYDPTYSKWQMDDLPILPEPWQFVITPGKKTQFAVLQNLMQWDGNRLFGYTAQQVLDYAQALYEKKLLPTMQVTEDALAALPAGERNVLTLVMVRLLCAIGEIHRYKDTLCCHVNTGAGGCRNSPAFSG